jgi:hypothetical protein
VSKESTFSPLEVKNKPCDEETDHELFLAQWTVQLRTEHNFLTITVVNIMGNKVYVSNLYLLGTH